MSNVFGSSGVRVNGLGFGAMELRGERHRLPRPIDEADAGRLLNTALDLGIDLIDTAIDYGASERLIGEHIAHRRDEYFLASKCGCPLNADEMVDAPRDRSLPHDYSRANIVAGVERSLRLLRTDHLDLIQVHVSPSRAELEEHGVPETLAELRASGKVRLVGISSELPHAPDHLDMGIFDAFQFPYSALNRRHEGVIRRAAAQGAGVIVRGGVAQGMVGHGRASAALWEQWDRARLDELFDGASRMEVMLRFTLSDPDIHTTIVGTASVAHLRENVAAAEKGPLSADVLQEMRARLEAVAADQEREDSRP